MWILFSLFAAANFFYVVIAKVNSNGFVNNSRSRYALYLTTTAIIGCAFLFVLGGFRISLNIQTLVYALFNTAITISFLIGNALIYKYAKISTVNILTSSAGMISAALVGRIVFNEPVTPKTLIKIAVMLVAVAFVYVNARRTSDEETLDIDRTARNKGRIVAFIISLTLVVAANQGLPIPSGLLLGPKGGLGKVPLGMALQKRLIFTQFFLGNKFCHASISIHYNRFYHTIFLDTLQGLSNGFPGGIFSVHYLTRKVLHGKIKLFQHLRKNGKNRGFSVFWQRI